MKNLSIFEPQIQKHYAYKEKNMYVPSLRTWNANERFLSLLTSESTLELNCLYSN